MRYREAHKVAGQICGYASLSGMAMSRPGAFFFHNARHGAMALVDGICLDVEARAAIDPHLGDILGVAVMTAAMGDSDDGGVCFITPRDLAKKNAAETALSRFEVWQFDWEAWCLPHIFAGITAGSHGDIEALRHFDTHFARSNHDRLEARRALGQRRGPAG